MKMRLVSHTHWDREWFLPAGFTREWLGPFFHSLAELMRADADYLFVLDGQSILLEDAAACGVLVPELAQELGRYCAAGRLLVGPYYLQPDWNLVSPEALVRNIEIGLADAAVLCATGLSGPASNIGEPVTGTGEPMKIGWLMDNFGQISQCPQIHASFGIDTVFMWRGLALPPEDVRSEYLWSSPDGSTVQAVYLLDSYRNAMRLLTPGTQDTGETIDTGHTGNIDTGHTDNTDNDVHAAQIERRVNSIADRIRPFSPTGLALLMNGYDQEMEPEAVTSALAALRGRGYDICQTTPQAFVAELRAALGEPSMPPLPVVQGEQYNGRFICVFPGVLSARSYLKRENYAVETEIEQYLEPLMAAATLVGEGSYTPPVERVEQVWRRILRNHPHDSICGVSVDDVHTDMEERFQRVRDELALLEQDALGALLLTAPGVSAGPASRTAPAGTAAAATPAAPENVSVFNPLPYHRSGVVSVTSATGGLEAAEAPAELLWVPDIPGLGWSLPSPTFSQTAGEVPVPAQYPQPVTADTQTRSISNGLLTVSAEQDGTLTLSNAAGTRFSGLLELEDGGDSGDTYTYAPPPVDRVVRGVRPEDVSVRVTGDGSLRATLLIGVTIRLPVGLSEDRSARAPEEAAVPVFHEVSLDAGASVLHITSSVRNTVRDHRLRIRFPVESAMQYLSVGAPFDAVTRPAVPPVQDEAEIGADLRQLMLGAREPDSIRTLAMRDYVCCSTQEGSRGLAVYAPGLFEYEFSEGAVCIPALRSVGWLARPDVSTRTGDAGPMIATPDAQCLRDVTVEFALYPFETKDERARVPARAAELRAPLRAYSGRAVKTGAMLEIESPNNTVLLSSARLKEGTFLARLYNPGEADVVAMASFHHRCSAVELRRLDGQSIETLHAQEDGRYAVRMPAHGIRTLAFALAAKGLAPDAVGHAADPVWQPGAPGAEPPLVRVDPVSVPPSANARAFLKSVSLPPVVDESFLAAERARCTRLSTQYAKARTQAETKQPNAYQAMLARSALSTARRTLLEAEISVIMAERKLKQTQSGRLLPGPYDEATRGALRRIGRELNDARIQKRTDDYLLAVTEGADSHATE